MDTERMSENIDQMGQYEWNINLGSVVGVECGVNCEGKSLCLNGMP